MQPVFGAFGAALPAAVGAELPIIYHVDFDPQSGELSWHTYAVSDYRDGYYICYVLDGTAAIHITDAQIDNPLCGYGRTRAEAAKNLLTWASEEHAAQSREVEERLAQFHALSAAQANLAVALSAE